MRTIATMALVAAVLGSSLSPAPASAETAPPTVEGSEARGAAATTGLVEMPVLGRGVTWAGEAGPPPPAQAHAHPAPGPAAARTAGSANATTTESSPPASAQAAPPAPAASASTAPASTDEFDIHYDESVSPEQAQVFEAAAARWAEVLHIRIPVTVTVAFAELAPGALGSAAPTSAWANDPSFPDANVAYVVSLANQHAGRDLDPGVPDVDVVISSEIDFYEGVDGNVPPDQYSLLLLALHELGHGLGHTTWARETTPGSNNFAVTIGGVPLSYDRFVANAGERRIVDMTASELRTALRNPLYWIGTEGARRASGPIRLYAPPTWEPGSSVGHSNDPAQLMYPFIFAGESLVSVPPLAAAMLADTGWPLPPVGDEAYVAAVARDFLDRFASPVEMREGAAALAKGTERGHLARTYAYSDEWIGALIDGYYRSTLGRTPDASGRAYWISVVRGGTTPAEVAALFYASAEYFSRAGGTNRKWVADLYREILRRPPESSGHAYWTALADGGFSRAVISKDFYQSIESRRTRVRRLYATLLGRTPDPGGESYWVDILKNGRDIDLALFLAASQEYYRRSLRRFS